MKRNSQTPVRCWIKAIAFSCILAGTGNALYAQAFLPPSTPWYIGVDGGVPFGYSTFKSFSSQHIHPGISFGVMGGYRFSSLLTAELSARMGRMTMSATPCCILSHLQLQEWDYSNLKSKVQFQEYAAQLNINLIELLELPINRSWILELSPRLGTSLTKTNIWTKDDQVLRIKGAHRWHMVMGGQLQMGMILSPRLSLEIYTGLSLLTGRYIDNIYSGYHASNYIWHNGLRLIYHLKLGKEAR